MTGARPRAPVAGACLSLPGTWRLVVLAALLAYFPAARAAPVPLVDNAGATVGSFEPSTGVVTPLRLWEVVAPGGAFSDMLGENTEWVSAVLSAAVFQRAQLNAADFFLASLVGADFSGATLLATDFSYSSAASASFMAVDARDAVFQHADLGGVDFSYANADRSDFRGASLEGADFTNTLLSGALFGPAPATPGRAQSLQDVDFRSADFGAGVTGIDTTTGSAIYDANTTLADIDPVALGWRKLPRRSVDLAGRYFSKLSFEPSDSASEGSFVGAFPETVQLPAEGGEALLPDEAFLAERVFYHIGSADPADALTMTALLAPQASSGRLRLWVVPSDPAPALGEALVYEVPASPNGERSLTFTARVPQQGYLLLSSFDNPAGRAPQPVPLMQLWLLAALVWLLAALAQFTLRARI